LSLGTERLRNDRATAQAWGVQVKWAQELQPGVAAGLSLAPLWQGRSAQDYQGSVAMGLVTWEAVQDVRLHLNLGRLLRQRGPDEALGGVSLDWRFTADWQGMVERYRVDSMHFARAGLRWTPVKGWSLDASRAKAISGSSGPSGQIWTLGVTREFD
jgi:hypothetical protein